MYFLIKSSKKVRALIFLS